MQFDNEKIRNIADVAAKIMAGETVSEELKGGQKKLDKNPYFLMHQRHLQ